MTWNAICKIDELIDNSGICALLNDKQVALFKLENEGVPQLYAIDNWDPIGGANVLSRGIVGSVKEDIVVASPLYKQHFSLLSGRCIEDENINVRVFATRIVDGVVEVAD